MRNRISIMLLAGLGIASSVAHAAGLPPFFTEWSPESVIVDLNAGRTSFECTGTAIDLDSGDAVYIYTAPLPSFMSIEIHNGNPATFRLYGENLTGANYGGYFVAVLALDELAQNGDSASFHISIIPEPTSIGILTLYAPLLRRRR